VVAQTIRSVHSAAPQLISISRPAGSTTSSRRSTSACRLMAGPVAVSRVPNHHGWVLCTDGDQTAASMAFRTIVADSSVRVRVLMVTP